MKLMQWTIVSALSALGACAGNGDGLDENGRPLEEQQDTLQPTFSSIQSHVLTPICTTCHSGGSAPLGLRLDEASSYALLVNAASVEVPELQRVQPGSPDASYLVQKLEGTAAVGGRMPLGQPALPADSIAVIRQWIADGAQDDRATGTAKPKLDSTVSLSAVSPSANAMLNVPPAEIVLSSNTALDLALLQSEVMTLRASGGDGTFADGNEQALPLQVAVRSANPTVLVLSSSGAAWPVDVYELRVSGGAPVALADIEGHVIDGDGDGQPGGDFILHFTVESTR